MKRVVTFVVPMGDNDPIEVGSLTGHESGLLPVPVDDAGFDPAALASGAMKVEVIVSDEHANRILAVVLQQGGHAKAGLDGDESSVEAAAALEVLVRKELETADPDAHDLLERIVMRVERQLISQVYADCDHVKSRAATRLGINRNTLVKKLRQFGEIEDESP